MFYDSVLALLLAIYTHLVPPAAGHYNCSDPSIWLPRKPDTVSTKILIILVFAAFFVFVRLIFRKPSNISSLPSVCTSDIYKYLRPRWCWRR